MLAVGRRCIALFVNLDFFSVISICSMIMEIKTHKMTQKANFAENKLRVLLEVAFERAMYSLPTIRQWQTPYSEVRGRITAKVNVCGVAKRSPQKVRNKRGALSRPVLNSPAELATRILGTTNTGEALSFH